MPKTIDMTIALPSGIAIDAGYVTNTSLVPAEKLTSAPALLEDRTVFLVKVLPDEVYVPIPTSHSEPDCPAMV